jgi:ribosomal protein L11 methyltransferase
VLAVDNDPDAVANAVANVARNHVSDRVRCVLGDASSVPTGPGSLVVANLMTAAHLRLAAAYRRYVAADGSLLLGGILEGETREVASVLAGEGFELCETQALDGWATLEFSRRG